MMAGDSSEDWKSPVAPPTRTTPDEICCAKCQRPVALPPGTVRVSKRSDEIVQALEVALLSQLPGSIAVCRDTLYRRIEQLERRCGELRDSILRF